MSEKLMVHVSFGLTWPFSLGQYQNGKVYAGAETDVPSGMESEAYGQLKEIVQGAIASQLEEINSKQGDGQ